MRVHYVILIVLTVLTLSIQVNAEANYWQTIKQYLKEDTTHSSAEGLPEAKEFLASLSADELIIAAKQCSAEIENQRPPEEWDMAGIALGFFYEYYPKKTNNLNDISPLLKELKDKSQSMFWRRTIMHLLGDWRNMLNTNQILKTAEAMHGIYKDDSEPLHLRTKAMRKSTELLKHNYSANLWNDPNAQQFAKQQKMRTRELIDAIQSGKVKLSQQTITANEKVLAEINLSITTQLSLFSDKQVNANLKESIIVAWAKYHECHLDPPQVSQSLVNAMNNYKNYDKEIWHLLVKTNIEDFENQNARVKLQEMINETKDEDIQKRLIRLNKKLKKSD